MSNGEVRKVSLQDIQLVQNLIERCLQLYMSQTEVVNTLLQQAKIEPGFTELVWQKLEAENRDFFRAYHVRLVVKEQIQRFNQLLERHVELMHQMSNGSQISMHDLSYQSPHQEDMHRSTVAMHNITYSVQQLSQMEANVQNRAGAIDASPNMLLARRSKSQILQGNSMKGEEDYAGDDSMMFGSGNNLVEARTVYGEASMSHFNGGDSGSRATGDNTLDPETMNSFGFLGHIPRNFSLSDLTADFSNSTDILDGYSKSPFLGTDVDFMEPYIGGNQQDIRRVDTTTKGFGYDYFSSD